MWVADPSDDKIYAYNVITSRGTPARTSACHPGTARPRLWSDGETMWVSDNSALKIYAYNMDTKGRDGGKDINLDLVNDNTETYGLCPTGRPCGSRTGLPSR